MRYLQIRKLNVKAKNVRVVLIQDVKNIGQRGSVVNVADGHAMNVLFPKKLAVPATPDNLKRVEKEAMAAKGKKDMDAALAKKALGDIHGKTIEMKMKANDAGVLFEAIKVKHVHEAILAAHGISLPESAIKLAEHIKKTGSYEVPVSIHGAKANVILNVQSQS